MKFKDASNRHITKPFAKLREIHPKTERGVDIRRQAHLPEIVKVQGC